MCKDDVPGLVAVNWWGVLLPAGSPKAIVAKLHADTVKALADPDVKKSFADLGVEAVSSTPEQFAAFIKSEMAKYGKLIKEANIKVNPVKPIEVAVIGTGWCGGIRAETLASHALVKGLHLAEINARPPGRAGRRSRSPTTATADYKELLKQNGNRGGLHLGHAGEHALPDREGLPRRGQARVPREADRARARRSRRADQDRARTRSSSSPSATRSASTRSSPTCASASATARSASR